MKSIIIKKLLANSLSKNFLMKNKKKYYKKINKKIKPKFNKNKS